MINTNRKLICDNCGFKDISIFKEYFKQTTGRPSFCQQAKQVEKGEILMHKGELLTGIYYVHEGTVKVSTTTNTKAKKEFIYWFVSSGEVIGIDALMNKDKLNFNATAITPVKACFIPSKEIHELIKSKPMISIHLMQDLCKKIDFIERRITSIAQKKIKAHFAELLLTFVFNNKVENPHNNRIDYTIKDIANTIGTTQNYLYKILSDLSNKKVISIENHKLKIENMDKLSLIAVGNAED